MEAPDSAPLLPGALTSSVAFLAVRLRNEFRPRLFGRYEEMGLRPTHGAILLCLEADPLLTQKGLVEVLRMDPSDAVRLLDELEQLGFIQRLPDPVDRRRKLLVLTDKGRVHTDKVRDLIAETDDEMLASLDENERRRFTSMLVKVVASVDERFRYAAEDQAAGVAR